MTKEVVILAIESSCDETSAAVVVNGRTLLSNIVASQIKSHMRFGGVVPEICFYWAVKNYGAPREQRSYYWVCSSKGYFQKTTKYQKYFDTH